MNDYFEKILQAEVYEVAKKTPLEKAHNLSNTLNNEIFLKREDLQDVFSFKIRGAYNKMSKLSMKTLRQPRFRLACKTAVGEGLQNGETGTMTIRINPRQHKG